VKVGSCVQIGHHLTTTVPIYPDVVVGRFVKVKFLGLVNRHTLKDNLFYLCVDKIVPIGYSNLDCSCNEGLLGKAIANYFVEEEERKAQMEEITYPSKPNKSSESLTTV